MDIQTSPQKRRSRVRRESAAKTVLVSPRDLEIFRLLDRYRYLPSNFIHAFVGGNSIRFKQRMGELFHEGFLNRPYRQWYALNARYRPAIYELDQRARAVLADLGQLSRHRVGLGSSFAHELMVCLAMASFELAARSDPALRFVPWSDLLGIVPEPTKEAAAPFAIPVTIAHAGERAAFELKPDGRPFALQYTDNGVGKRSLFFPGFEIDRHTEPLAVVDLERSSILKKALAYREIVASEGYKTHFGFPNMLVPFITVNAEHMRNMIELVMKLTNGKGASYLLFKTMPDLVSVERTIDPMLDIVSQPWLRAGRAPFDLLSELRAA